MKSLMIAVFAVLGLAGCVAVPYHAGPDAGYYSYGVPVAPVIHFRYGYHPHRHRHRYY